MSRRRRSAIFVLCLLLAAVFIWLDHSPVKRKWQRQSQSADQPEAYDFQKYHAKIFTVVNIVDGDTIDIDVPEDRKLINRFPCIALWSTLGIHSNGDVNLCCIDFANSVPLGNARQQSIEEIWKGEKLKQIRQMHLQGHRAEIPICDGCPVWFDRVDWKQGCGKAD